MYFNAINIENVRFVNALQLVFQILVSQLAFVSWTSPEVYMSAYSNVGHKLAQFNFNPSSR